MRRGTSKATFIALILLVIAAASAGAIALLKHPTTIEAASPAAAAISTDPTATSSTATPATSTATQATQMATTTSAPATTGSYIVIKDFRGKLVKIKQPIERVVVLQSYWAEVLVALGAGDKVVGVGKYVKYDAYLPEGVRSKPSVGSTFSGINIEEVIALKPDVVITDFGYGKADEFIPKLEELGIPVVGLFCRSFSDQLKAVELLGKVVGAEGKAEELINFMKSRYELVLSKVADVASKPKVVALSASGILKGYLSTYANTSWGRMIEEVGAINIALHEFPSKSWPRIDFETLAKWDPDVILLIGSKGSIVPALDKVRSDNRFSILKAIKEGRVYAIPAWSSLGAVLDWGPRVVVGYEYLAKLLHPEACGNINWRADMVYLLKHFYGIDVPQQAFSAYSIEWREVVDFRGKEVKVPLHVRRAVDLISYITDLALGVMDRLVGVSKYAYSNPLVTKAYPNITSVPSPGSSFSLNVEEVAALKPDVVFMWNYKPDLVAEVEKLGIPVICVNLKSYSDIKALITLLGEVYGVEDRAEELLSNMDSIIAMVRERVSSVPEGERVKVLYLWSRPTKVQGGRGTMEDAIELAGCVNPAAAELANKSYANVDFEQIVKWNPDIIVTWWHAKYTPETLLNDSRWQVINAVKKGNVFREPYFEHWGPDFTLFVLWLAKKAYPSLFSDINVTEVMDEYYMKWYGIKYSDLFSESRQGG